MNRAEQTTLVQPMLDHIVEECTAIDCDEVFDQMLDEVYDFSEVGGPFEYMQASRVLAGVDPIAYRCGCNDYIDSLETYEIEGETYYICDVTKSQEGYIEGLEAELSDLEDKLSNNRDELEDLREEGLDESELESRVEECDELETQITDLQQRIEACKTYQF